jgi:hypothetical protein
MKTLGVVTAAVLAFTALIGHDSVAAQDRSELISQARAQPTDSLAMHVLLQAADPGLAPLDSLWAVSVHDLALTLVGVGEATDAGVWLRWSARHGAVWPIDRSLPSDVVDAYDQAVSTVQSGGGLGDPVVSTSWRWPGVFDADAPGVVAVISADPSTQMTVSVQGSGTVAPGEDLTLPAGTYELVASADGYESARVEREILPGVATVLAFDLVPVLSDAPRAAAIRSLVSIRYMSGGQQICTTGFLGRPDGFVFTARSALGVESGLEVTTATGVFSGVAVERSNPELNLAVLKLDLTAQPTLPRAAGISTGQHVWSAFHPGCDAPTSAHARLGDWPTTPTDVVRLATSLSPDASGGPLFNQSGQLVGIMVGIDQVVPANLADGLLPLLAEDRTVPQGPQAGGGGPPWGWIGAGVAAAGVAAAVLLGGGDGGGGDEVPTTGSIIATWPGGMP